ncbi:MAG: aldo/keto reductase [Caldilineaceae bacterium SB0661_bin_34]|nr:aldo/keto reductase [Caldilineaceae bacterium SB0661_bin_34]
MEYRLLGRTGVKVSPLCFGVMMFGHGQFGGGVDVDDASRMLQVAFDAGINFIDTANVYSRGQSEEILGEALKRSGQRSRVVLATKVHFPMADDDPNMGGTSRRHVIEQCHASLKRLQTDYIDLYQLHRPRTDTPIDETLRALDDLVRDGKVRYIGTSTYAAWQFVESLWVSKEYGLNRFVTEQPPYNILDRRIERELLPMAQNYGVAILPWSPLAGGLLAGKYKRGKDAPEGSRYALRPRPERTPEGIYDVIEGLDPLAANKGCTVAQFALAWAMGQPNITSPIIGPRTLEQLEDNLGALQVSLDDSDREAVDTLVPPGTNVSLYYESNFGAGEFRW